MNEKEKGRKKKKKVADEGERYWSRNNRKLN